MNKPIKHTCRMFSLSSFAVKFKKYLFLKPNLKSKNTYKNIENKIMKINLLFFTLSLVFSTHVSAQENCEERFEILYSKYANASKSDFYELWKDERENCNGSDFYELKKGWLEIILEQLETAKITFETGLEKNQAYAPDLELALADLVFQKAARGKQVANKALLAEAEMRMSAFINKYPQRSDGYSQMTGIMLVKGDNEKVIDYANLAKEFGEEPFALRNAVIAYYELGNDNASIESANSALQIDSSFQTDIDFMLSAALAYGNVGKFKVALGIFSMLHNANDKAQATPKFQNALQFVRQQYIDNEKKKGSALNTNKN